MSAATSSGAPAPRVLVVVPAHDEEASVGGVLLGLRRSAPEFDRLVVDDGSTDGTARVVSRMGERVLRLPANLGYGQALRTGMKFALQHRYDLVVSLDADGQHRPEDVPGLVQAQVETGADLVIGSRYCDGRRYAGPLSRRVGQRLFSWLSRPLLGVRIHDTTSGLKVLSARACERLVDSTFLDFHVEAFVRLARSGLRIVERPVEILERRHGRSMHSHVSIVAYPVRTLLLTLVALLDAWLAGRTR